MKLENQKIETWGIRLLDHRWYSWNAFCRHAAGPSVVFMKPDKKKMKLWGWISRWRPVDRRFAPIDRGRHREIQPQSFNLFFCLVSWNHPRARCAAAKSVSWNHLWSRSRNLRFQFIWFSSFMKPPKVSSFHVKIVVKPSKISKQVNETRSQKKNARFLFKTHKHKTKRGFYRKLPWSSWGGYIVETCSKVLK